MLQECVKINLMNIIRIRCARNNNLILKHKFYTHRHWHMTYKNVEIYIIILDTDQDKSLKFCSNDIYCRKWNKWTAFEEVSTTKSCTGYAIIPLGCTIIWASKIHMKISLSATGYECIDLLQSFNDFIYVLILLK